MTNQGGLYWVDPPLGEGDVNMATRDTYSATMPGMKPVKLENGGWTLVSDRLTPAEEAAEIERQNDASNLYQVESALRQRADAALIKVQKRREEAAERR